MNPTELSAGLRTAASVSGTKQVLRQLFYEAAEFIDRAAPIIEALKPIPSASDQYIEQHGYEDKG